MERQEKIDELSYEKTLFSEGIPGIGVAIADIFEIGATFKYAVGWTTKFKGICKFKAGMTASLPGTAKLSVDGAHYEQSSAVGFEGFVVDPVFELESLSQPIEFSLAAKPKLTFGVSIVNVADLDIALVINLPELQAKITRKYGTSSTGNITTVVNLSYLLQRLKERAPRM